MYCYLSLLMLEIHWSLQFHLTLSAVIGNFRKIEVYEIMLAPVHFRPLAEYCHSFKIFHTSHSCFFHKAYNWEDMRCSLLPVSEKNSLVCNRDCGGHKAAILLNKTLGHVSLYIKTW